MHTRASASPWWTFFVRTADRDEKFLWRNADGGQKISLRNANGGQEISLRNADGGQEISLRNADGGQEMFLVEDFRRWTFFLSTPPNAGGQRISLADVRRRTPMYLGLPT